MTNFSGFYVFEVCTKTRTSPKKYVQKPAEVCTKTRTSPKKYVQKPALEGKVCTKTRT